MRQKLTVLIPCKNEAEHILACIESVRDIADEILVATSPCTDNTIELIHQAGGCRIIERALVNHADFKNWAIPQASHPWVLIVDADERLTEDFRAEVREVLAQDDPAYDAYRMQRENIFLGRRVRHCGWNHSMIIRLIRRDVCRYGAARVHERLEVAADRVGTLRHRIVHYTCVSFRQWTERQNSCTTVWAEDQFAAGRTTTWLGILFRPILRFLQLYLFRGGFLDGTVGLVVCFSSTFYTFLKYAKLWVLNKVAKNREMPAKPALPAPQTAMLPSSRISSAA